MTPPNDEAANDDLALPLAELDLLSYLDGELDPSRAVAFESRLRGDPQYAARLRALSAVCDFVRDDADRIYNTAAVDGIVDDVMAKIRAEGSAPVIPVSIPVSSAVPVSRHARADVAPPTSRAGRRNKGIVIWGAFGAVAAAAAALFLYVQAQPAKQSVATSGEKSTPADTVAQVKKKEPALTRSATDDHQVSETDNSVEVENLEVGQGATVIYTRSSSGSNPVVWFSEKH
ncbi:MAG: hypothetical protein NVS3B20_01050 [Polyangiales bacterium]